MVTESVGLTGWNGLGNSGLTGGQFGRPIPLGEPGTPIEGVASLVGWKWGYRKGPLGYTAIAVSPDGTTIPVGGTNIDPAKFTAWGEQQDGSYIATPAPSQTIGPSGLPEVPLLTNDPISGDPITNFPAPPGYGWAIDPTDNKKVLIDLTPLDKSKPAQNWHWVANDPAQPNTGAWVYTADQSDFDRTFAGVPKSVLPWLQYALNQGGSLNGVPTEAHAWLNYLMNHASDAGRLRPGEVPFGLGLPNWEGNTPQAPLAPTLGPNGEFVIDPGGMNGNDPNTPGTTVPTIIPNPNSSGRYTDVSGDIKVGGDGSLVWGGEGDAPVWTGNGPPPAWWFKAPTNLPNIPPPGAGPTGTPTQPPIVSQQAPIPHQNPPLHPDPMLPPPPPSSPDLSQIIPKYPVATIQAPQQAPTPEGNWGAPAGPSPTQGEWYTAPAPPQYDPYVMTAG